VHPLRPCLDVLDDDGHPLTICHPVRHTKSYSSYYRHKAVNKSDAVSLRPCVALTIKVSERQRMRELWKGPCFLLVGEQRNSILDVKFKVELSDVPEI
jgi:hypothetical protein